MSEKIMFGDTEVKKHEFHQYKSSILLYNENIDRIVVSYKVKIPNISLGAKMILKKIFCCV